MLLVLRPPTAQQLLLLHHHLQPSGLEEDPFPCSSGPLLQAQRNMPSKLPFAFLLSTSSRRGFSSKRSHQASPSVAPPAIYLLQESSTLSLGTSQLIVPFQLCFDLTQMLATIFLSSPWLPLHLPELDPAQEELLLSYKCFGPILTNGASHPLAQQYGY